MDAQNFRSLQEAYMEVVMNVLDESRGDDLRKKHRLKPGEVSQRLSRRADTKTFKYERNDPRRDALSDLSGFAGARSEGDTNLHGTRERVKRGGRPSGTNIHTHADRDRGDKEERFADFVQGKRDSPNMSDTERRTVNFGRTSRYKKEEVDLYDIILSHLLDEGYAETPEAAEVIMVNMSEEWREDIVEELTGERKKRALEIGGYLANRVATGKEGQPLERRNRSGVITMRTTTKGPTKRGGGGFKGRTKSDWYGTDDTHGSGNKSRRRGGLKVKDTSDEV